MKLEYATTITSEDSEKEIAVDVEADLCLERGPFYRKADFRAYYAAGPNKGNRVDLFDWQWTQLNEELQIREFGSL